MKRPTDQDGRAFVGAVLIGEEHPRMLRQVDDGEIAVVVGVGEVLWTGLMGGRPYPIRPRVTYQATTAEAR